MNHSQDRQGQEVLVRKSHRLFTHNYGWTATYFITIKAAQREPVFEVPELRALLQETWGALPTRFPCVQLDESIIMPDHVHFILHFQKTDTQGPTLGQVVGAYKSITTVQWLNAIKAKDLFWPDKV